MVIHYRYGVLAMILLKQLETTFGSNANTRAFREELERLMAQYKVQSDDTTAGVHQKFMDRIHELEQQNQMLRSQLN